MTETSSSSASASTGRAFGLSFLLAVGGGLYGYGQNGWEGAGIGVIVGALAGLAIGIVLVVIILAGIAAFAVWADKH